MVDDNESDIPDLDDWDAAPEIDWGDEAEQTHVVISPAERWESLPPPSPVRTIAIGVTAAIALIVGLVVVVLLLRDGDEPSATIEVPASTIVSQEPTATTEATSTDEDATAPSTTRAERTTTEPTPEDEAPAAVTDDESASADDASSEPETTATATTPATTASTAPLAADPAPRTTRARRAQETTYDTLPDGTPVPIVAVFDTDTITLTGAVPSKKAQERLRTLALANAKPGQGDNLIDETRVVRGVPQGIGVRVVELTSSRFPEGTAEVVGAHAEELNRIATVMNALPNVTALVVGHADQRGADEANFEISRQRAEAVVQYLASQGISPDRLSSRAVGENDLISLEENDVAYALNRRTEFILYGLLLDE